MTTRPISIGWMWRPSWAGTMPGKERVAAAPSFARHLVRDLSKHWRRDAARTDGIDIDVLGRPFAGKRTG